MSLRNSNVTNPSKRKRVAIVLSNPATSTTTGWPVGFWWSELTHPYYRFQEQGYERAAPHSLWQARQITLQLPVAFLHLPLREVVTVHRLLQFKQHVFSPVPF
jgi:hypothetical protein